MTNNFVVQAREKKKKKWKDELWQPCMHTAFQGKRNGGKCI